MIYIIYIVYILYIYIFTFAQFSITLERYLRDLRQAIVKYHFFQLVTEKKKNKDSISHAMAPPSKFKKADLIFTEIFKTL